MAITDPEFSSASQFLLPITASSSSSSRPTATATTSGGGQPESGHSRIGIIVGVTLAGVLVLLVALTTYLLWKKRKAQARLDIKAHLGHEFDHEASGGEGQSEQFLQGGMSTTPRTRESTFLALRSSHELEANCSSPLVPDNFYSPQLSPLSELEGSSRRNVK
ncbi:hypothetical protein O1611_g5486 [Lasiodiplodia mahajangana]|uniref:Uncharacterized protein n=1 Tax=Lasiodiplodia mahajangana TaxID=1108764 RepID=A0ACC2JKW1_9PEZI|nr:hypothetical protein O1611_g5486 [Lasiodiplodia mahajangana]